MLPLRKIFPSFGNACFTLALRAKQFADVMAECVQFPEWLGRAIFIDDPRADERSVAWVVIENKKENVIAKGEQIAPDVRLVILRCGPSGNRGFHLSDAVWSQQRMVETIESGRAD